MDVKGAFDHLAKNQLITQILELGIDGDLVRWTSSFLTNCKLQLTIDGYTNREKKIETGIPQGSPVLPVLFLIYISGVFVKIQRDLPTVLSLLFVDHLGFIATGQFPKEIADTLEKVGHIALKWGRKNTVT